MYTKCLKCGYEITDADDYCPSCGTHKIILLQNYCINSSCERFKDSSFVKDEQMYCGKCGTPTAYGNKIIKFT